LGNFNLTFNGSDVSYSLGSAVYSDPGLVNLTSAGFDAHERDPLGSLNMTADDFAWVTRELMKSAEKNCQGRLVAVLEGGYDLQGLADSVSAHVGELMKS